MIFFLFLLKTLIVDTCKNRPTGAVLTSTHNLCIRAKIRKMCKPFKPQFFYAKVGCYGVYITRTCFHDDAFVDSILDKSVPRVNVSHP